MTAGETAMTTYTFNPGNQPVRVETIGGEPWFVAKDVCDALTISNNRDAVALLDEDEKLMSVITTSGQGRQMWLVNESGLYNLIFQSRKPEARKFRKWVTSEVLPAIRRTGGYMMPGLQPKPQPAGRLMPRERSGEMAAFYRELQRWTTSADVDEVAAMTGCKRKTVLEARRGARMHIASVELLVSYAMDNRRENRQTDIISSRPQYIQQRLEQLCFDFMKEEGGAL